MNKTNAWTGIGILILSLAAGTALWASLVWWLGWLGTLSSAGALLGLVYASNKFKRTKARKWIPTDAHGMARALVTDWGFTLEEGWEIVELLESILRAEHTLAHAWMFVRILMLRTDKERTLGVLRTLAGKGKPKVVLPMVESTYGGVGEASQADGVTVQLPPGR